MLVPTIFLLSLGLIAAIGLAIASKVFYVWEDPKILEVEDALLGANCGGCGFPGCSAAAESVVQGNSGADICVAGGPEIAMNVADIMGLKVEAKEPEISTLSCIYSTKEADTKYIYNGINDCRAAVLFSGGVKECPIGCLGLGTCVRACPFGALEMGENGLPVVIVEKCRSCGVCVEVCPKEIIKLSSSTNRMIGEYTTDECTTPCQRTCPTGIDIPGYIREIKKGNYDEALRIIKEKNPLPLVCGRICPAPCELECRRNLNDEPVAINNLKRFAADYAMNNGGSVDLYKLPDTGIKLAVIGGGAQGLTSAYYLSCFGHEPTIYEATSKLGGIIRNVIPESRLPGKVIDYEVQTILDNGVKAEMNKALGKDISIGSLLKDGFDAVILAGGGIDGRKVLRGNIDLEQTIPGVYTLIDFITNKDNSELKTGRNVLITGLGNSTLEAARICKQKGADVTIIYPYSEEDIAQRGIDIESPVKEGIKISYCTEITKLTGEGDELKQIVVRDGDGKMDTLDADTVIVSTGRLADIVIAKPLNEDGEIQKDSAIWESIEVFKAFPGTASNDMFNIAEKAVINDNLAVVKAIGRGRKIARAVTQHLNGREPAPQETVISSGMEILDVDSLSGVSKTGKEAMPMKISNFCDMEVTEKFYMSENSFGYTAEQAKRESDRCLDCGLICYKKS